MLLAHHFLQLYTVVPTFAEFLGDLFDVGKSVVYILGHIRKLFGETVIALGQHTLGLLISDVCNWVIGVSPANTVIALDGIFCLFRLFVGDGVVGERVWSFEGHIREEALVVGEAAPTECDLLDAIGHHHVQQSLGATLYVIRQHYFSLHVPYLQVVSARSQQEVLLVEGHTADRHRLTASASHWLAWLIVQSGQSVHAPCCYQSLRGGQAEHRCFHLIQEEWLHHPQLERAEQAIIATREEYLRGGDCECIDSFLVGLHIGNSVFGAHVPHLHRSIRRAADEQVVGGPVAGQSGDFDGVSLEGGVD